MTFKKILCFLIGHDDPVLKNPYNLSTDALYEIWRNKCRECLRCGKELKRIRTVIENSIEMNKNIYDQNKIIPTFKASELKEKLNQHSRFIKFTTFPVYDYDSNGVVVEYPDGVRKKLVEVLEERDQIIFDHINNQNNIPFIIRNGELRKHSGHTCYIYPEEVEAGILTICLECTESSAEIE